MDENAPSSRPRLYLTPRAADEIPTSSTRTTSRAQQIKTGSQKRRTRSPNHVRPKPADPQVMSSILQSLDAFSSLNTNTNRDSIYTVVDGVDSRPTSLRSISKPSSGRTHSFSKTMTGHGFGMDYGAYNNPASEGPPGDSADFPVVGTGRRTSQLSTESASLHRSNSGLRRLMRTASNRSKTSALSAEAERDASVSSLGTASDARTNRQPSPVSMSQQRHQDVEKDAIVREEEAEHQTENTTQSLRSTSDADINRRTTSASGDSTTPAARLNIVKPYTMERTSTPSNRPSPLKNLVTDSIPLRTSSLRQSEVVEGKKSKSRTKLRHHSTSAIVQEKDIAPEAQESRPDVLDELGEEDETVKRIRELRQKRETRLQIISSPSDSWISPSSSRNSSTRSSVDPAVLQSIQVPSPFREAFSKAHATSPTPRQPSTVNSASTPQRSAEDAKARKVLGLAAPRTSDVAPTPIRHVSQLSTKSQSAGPKARRVSQANRTSSADTDTRRQTIARNPSSRLSLELSSPNLVVNGPDGLPLSDERLATHGKSSNVKALNLVGLEDRRSTHRASRISTAPSTRNSSANPVIAKKKQLNSLEHPDFPHQNNLRLRRVSMSDVQRKQLEEFNVEDGQRGSIEAAVTSYLENSRLNRMVRHPQTNRKIVFSDVGDPKGSVVFVCVGMGLTRFITAFYDELATTLRLRLITPDRPGVGGSDPYPETEQSGPLSWPDDVHTICQDLGINKFSILAHSAGAIYALATALIMPHYLHGKVHLLAPWIPASQLQTYGHNRNGANAPPAGNLPRSQRFLRALPVPFLKAANSTFLGINTGSMNPDGGRRKSPSSDRDRKRRESSISTTNGNGATPLRPKNTVRKSMMLMDQEQPNQNGSVSFFLPGMADSKDKHLGREANNKADQDEKAERPLYLSATIRPGEDDFSFATESLHAAEHAARARQAIYSSMLTERTWALATKNSNPAVDLLVCLERHRDVGFRYVDIQRKVVITHGDEDKRVPVENVRWIGEQMNRRMMTSSSGPPRNRQQVDDYGYGSGNGNEDGMMRDYGGCEVRVLPGEGHGLMASPIVMGDVLAEMAREWKSYKRT